jgi:acyl carrier protein
VEAADVRAFVLGLHEPLLLAQGLTLSAVPDDFDLREQGMIDSFGVLELIGAIEERFGITVDFEDLDPEEMTVVGPLSRYVERKTGAGEPA